MLNRRHLRIKVMHALYAFFQSENNDLKKGEKELFYSIEKIYDLYIYLLLLIPEIKDFALKTIEEGKVKMLPTAEDLNPNMKFANNLVAAQLSVNEELNKKARNRKINWNGEEEMIKKIFNSIKASEEYAAYMTNPQQTFEEDQQLIIDIFKNHIAGFELLEFFFEERSIYWMDDFELVFSSVVKTVKQLKSNNPTQDLMPLFKDEEDDRKFAEELFRRTIIKGQDYENLISERTKNWEVDRIAMMDILLMKMAIAEAVYFPGIPLKVTLNEYIEIAKEYSTPKSKVFINGILDKLLLSMRSNGEIVKTGRGLIE